MPLTRDVYIPVTNDCIHDCIFCSFPKVHGQHFSLDKIKRIIDYYKKYNYTDINFTGGEPTLHPELDKIISYAVSKGYNVRITTNGVKLADMNLLKKLYDAGLKRILFSIHHSDPEEARKINNIHEEDLSYTLRGVENADKLGIDININITIIKQNYKDLLNIVKMLVPRFSNIHHFNFNFVDVTGNVFNLKQGLMPQEIVPKYSEAEKYLLESFKYLDQLGISFRFERAPLCYAGGFEHKNSNANRLAGTEFHVTINFEKEEIIHDNLLYLGKSDVCKICTLNDFCNGLEKNYIDLYGVNELYPIFINPNLVEYRIKNENREYKEIVIKRNIDFLKEREENESILMLEDIFNTYFGLFSHLRNDTRYLINIFDSPFREDFILKINLLFSFFKLLEIYKYDLRNFYILIPSEEEKYRKLLKLVQDNKYNYIYFNEFQRVYSFSKKNKHYYKIAKEIDSFYGIINFLFPNSNLYLENDDVFSILEFLLIFSEKSEIEEYLAADSNKKHSILLDLFSIFKPKMKNNFLLLDNSVLFSKDLIAFEYILEEKFQKYNFLLDLIKENFLSYINNLNVIDVKEI